MSAWCGILDSVSYNFTSNQTSDTSQIAVQLDIVRRGWIFCLPSSRDARYDLLVDRGLQASPRFETLQIKTIHNSRFRCTTRPCTKEFVSANGKARNNYHYRDLGIDWMVGVNNNGECWYYPYHVFTHYETIDIRTVPPTEFGRALVSSSQSPTYMFDGPIVSLDVNV